MLLQKNKGVSLVELLLVTVAVGFLVLLMANLPNAINLIGKARHKAVIREIIVSEIERKRALAYANLTDGQTTLNDSRLAELSGGSGTTLVEPCGAPICNGESTKKITVTVAWKEAGKPQSVSLYTLISAGGINK